MVINGMAFMGLFLAFFVIVLAILGFVTLLAIVFLIIAGVKYRSWKKHPERRRTYIVFQVLGCICISPIVGVVVFIIYCYVSTAVQHNTSLSYNVQYGNYEKAEQILKKGANPDCTIESDKPAKPGEQTLLSVLCEKGFVDVHGDPVDDVETKEELAMIQLLIDYGADIESRTYDEDMSQHHHSYEEDSDIYMVSDACGYTPLLHAVRNGNIKTTKLLVENGADINAADYCGFNAVATVADNLSDQEGEELLSYLLEQGGDENAATNFYQNAYFLASRNNLLDNDKIVEMLEVSHFNMFD